MTAAGSGEASPQRARGAVRGGRGALRVEKTSPTAARGAFLRGNVRRAGRQRALSAAVERSLGEKTPPQQRGGVFVRQYSPGRAAKGAVCGGRGVLRAERHLRSSAGAFLRGNVRRAGRQRALSAAVERSLGEKTPPWRAGAFLRGNVRGAGRQRALSAAAERSPGRKNVPRSARERLSRLVRPYGGAKRPAAPGLTSGGALAPLRPPPFPHPPQRAGPDASPPGARACTGPRRRRRPTGGRRTSGGCRNDSA